MAPTQPPSMTGKPKVRVPAASQGRTLRLCCLRDWTDRQIAQNMIAYCSYCRSLCMLVDQTFGHNEFRFIPILIHNAVGFGSGGSWIQLSPCCGSL